ncbi:hypothetical protein HII31_12331 [Pseudocercospora fuligena]|uniref:F-box domain-containing protein n=1 Tax=Pseudocercospora fuligena TaxID=685502 RepID=A0A8H6R5F5_9PEZI|nr:hypothetical protein HII31_12331 [Pseudocercospora fuligena]
MSLLGLPTELLDQIFGYLDWNQDEDLYPTKQSIINGSVTCKQLRKVLVPLVFQDVTLKICWAGGVLVSPALLKLRREKPELARHIKCVYIRTDFTFIAQYNDHPDWDPFITPDDAEDWLRYSEHRTTPNQLETFRQRANEIAQDIERSQSSSISENPHNFNRIAEQAIRYIVVPHPSGRYHAQHEKLIALALVMLCIPPSINSLVIRILADGDVTDTKPRFALCVAATAVEMLRDWLTDITFVASGTGESIGRGTPTSNGVYGTKYFTPDAVGRTAVQHLTLASAEKMSLLSRSSRWLQQGLDCWISASDTIVALNLKNIATNLPDLAAFIAKFTQLKHLRISNVVLSPIQGHGHGQAGPEVQARIWLRLSIDVRRALPNTDIRLGRLCMPVYSSITGISRHEDLPPDAITWLQKAVLGEKLLDADREERLLEDFDSFLPLWAAEADLERGPKAVTEWDKMRGKLSDQAMSRRWR